MRNLCILIGLAAMLCSMLLPLPGWLMDLFLIGNLVFALLLLVSALYIPEPTKLSSLPTMLLLATLFRLSLNVSSTRLILSASDVGRAIEAFGSIVIQGNLVVGIVVFLVITLIQFIVIAKGSERVAEVSARFTLDALPGKQMSIDADVRAGLIDFEMARQKRQELQIESRFYGALDGAMKFIKGDAIAGIVITFVNIGGGLLAGLMVEQLELGAAVSKYTLLTVGDGLISQIPALLNALSAGIIVTRVSRGDGQSLAHDLISQIGQSVEAKFTIAVISAAMAFFPGMPALPFIVISMALVASAIPWQRSQTNQTQTVKIFQPRIPALLSIEIPRSAAPLLQKGGFELALKNWQERIHRERGLVLLIPELNLQENGETRILVRGLVVARLANSEELSAAIIAELDAVVATRGAELVDDIVTRRILDFFDKEAPELVSAVIPTIVTVTQLSEILRALVRDHISVRNIDLILQAIAERGGKAANERMLLEEVRIALRRVISHRYFSAEPKRLLGVHPMLDLAIAKVERENGIIDVDHILHVAQFIEHYGEKDLIVVCSRASRRIICEGLRLKGVATPVIAHEELDEAVNAERVGIVELPESSDEIVEALAA
jgi:type III secretion protein V